MAPAVSFVSLTGSQVLTRFNRIVDHLDHWGDVIARDAGRATERRMLEFAVLAPGGGLAVEVRELFREHYARNRAGDWDIVKYTYEYLDISHSARLAFHVHDIGARKRVAHAHCEESVDIPDEERSAHLRSVEYEIREAHDAFMHLYAAGGTPDCTGYLPLEIDRT